MMIWKMMTITTMTIVMMTVTMSKVANQVTASNILGSFDVGVAAVPAEPSWTNWFPNQLKPPKILFISPAYCKTGARNFRYILCYPRVALSAPRSSFVTSNIFTVCHLPKHWKFQTGHFRPRWIFPRLIKCCDWYRSPCTATEGEISEFDLFDGVLKMNTINVSSRLKMKTTCCPAMHNFYLTLYHVQKMKRVD